MMIKIKKIIVFTIFLSVFTCKQKPISEYYENGEIRKEFYLDNGKLNGLYKEYYSNGDIKLMHHFQDDVKIDSSTYYYKNSQKKIERIIYWSAKDKNDTDKLIEYDLYGNVSKKGFVDKNLIALGYWKYYDSTGNINSIREYKNIQNNGYLNQEWRYNKKGDTLYYPSHYFKITKSRDTFAINYPFRAVATVILPLFKEKKSEIFVIIPKTGFNFNKDFSNEKEIELDTFYNLTKDTLNQKLFPNVNFKLNAAFGKRFKSTGDHFIRGYIVEYYEQDPDSIGVIKEDHKKYFEIPVYVKDTIDNGKN